MQQLGGVPKLVEAIAAGKRRKASCTMLAQARKDLRYHVERDETERALASRDWEFVVLQDACFKPTRLGSVRGFLSSGGTFYELIRQRAPGAMIVLYETWATERGYNYFSQTAGRMVHVQPAEMITEVRRGYATMKELLGGLEPGEQVRLARVGTAFAACRRKFPEVHLRTADGLHATEHGDYLAALVLYKAIFRDSPVGAVRHFPGVTVDSSTAAKLQQIAAGVEN